MSLLSNMLSRLAITFLPRIKHLWISWCSHHLQWFCSPPKIKPVTVSTVSPSICHEVMGLDAMILVFWMLSFKPTFSLSSFTFIKRLFSSSLLSAIRLVSSAYLRLLIFLPAIFPVMVANMSSLWIYLWCASFLQASIFNRISTPVVLSINLSLPITTYSSLDLILHILFFLITQSSDLIASRSCFSVLTIPSWQLIYQLLMLTLSFWHRLSFLYSNFVINYCNHLFAYTEKPLSSNRFVGDIFLCLSTFVYLKMCSFHLYFQESIYWI